MTVNITLFVQMINFFVFYMLIKRILIDPFLHTKYHYDQDQQRIDQWYVQACNELAHAQDTKKQMWNNALKDLATQVPLKPVEPLLCAPTIQSYSVKIDAQDIAQAAKSNARALLHKGV